MREEWKDIQGYEGLYQVSNLGRFKSLPRKVKWLAKNGKEVFRLDEEKILRQEILNTGYSRVCFCIKSKKIRKNAHRMVAKAFIPNTENKPCINHIDRDRTNNNIKNLEWCTYSENNYHCWSKENRECYLSKKVMCVETGEVFKSCSEASKSMGLSRKSVNNAISKNIKTKTAGGFKWVLV